MYSIRAPGMFLYCLACRLTFDQRSSLFLIWSSSAEFHTPAPTEIEKETRLIEVTKSPFAASSKSIGRALIAVISAAREMRRSTPRCRRNHTQGWQIKNNDSISTRGVVSRFHFIDKVVQQRSVSVSNGIKSFATKPTLARAHKKREFLKQWRKRNREMQIYLSMQIDFLNVSQACDKKQ